jgi:uncharacterized integral membrane protein
MNNKIWALAVLLALLVVILIQNTQEVVFRIFFWKISMSQVIFLPLAVLVGFLFGFFVAKVSGRKKS